MKVAEGIEMLEITATMMGKSNTIHPTLLWDDHIVVLVDTGYPGQFPLIQSAIEKTGISFSKIRKIIITHQDLDHIGSLPNILDSFPAIEVLSNGMEKPYIEGEKKLVKLSPEAIAQAMDSLPDDIPDQWRQAFKTTLENPPKASVTATVTDGEELPYCGGIFIINTPGHTPGHISLFHKENKTLIAGDALVVEDNRLLPSIPSLTYDMDAAMQSIEKLTHLDIDKVICYHGGIYKGNVNERLMEILKGYKMYRHN